MYAHTHTHSHTHIYIYIVSLNVHPKTQNLFSDAEDLVLSFEMQVKS